MLNNYVQGLLLRILGVCDLLLVTLVSIHACIHNRSGITPNASHAVLSQEQHVFFDLLIIDYWRTESIVLLTHLIYRSIYIYYALN